MSHHIPKIVGRRALSARSSRRCGSTSKRPNATLAAGTKATSISFDYIAARPEQASRLRYRAIASLEAFHPVRRFARS